MANPSDSQNKGRTSGTVAEREAFWRGAIERWKTSGLAQRPFCDQEDLSASALSWWIRELRRRDEGRPRPPRVRRARVSPAPASFVPVRVRTSFPTEPLEIVVGRHVIRVRAGFDREALLSLVAALEKPSC